MFAPVSGLVHRLLERRQARRAQAQDAEIYRRLLDSDDHTLCDLGVTRHDVLRLLNALAQQ